MESDPNESQMESDPNESPGPSGHPNPLNGARQTDRPNVLR